MGFRRYPLPQDGLCFWHGDVLSEDPSLIDAFERDQRGCATSDDRRVEETNLAMTASERFMKDQRRWNEDNPRDADFHVEREDVPLACSYLRRDVRIIIGEEVRDHVPNEEHDVLHVCAMLEGEKRPRLTLVF